MHITDMLHIICISYAAYHMHDSNVEIEKAGNTNTWFNKTESDVIEEIQQIDDSNQGKCLIM